MFGQLGPQGVRTNRGRLDHVSDCESLDCLVLGCTSRTIGTANGLDVASAFLVSSTVVNSAFNVRHQ